MTQCLKKVFKSKCSVIFVIFFILYFIFPINATDKSNEWDLLIFSQQWPITVCYEWKQKNSNHKCRYVKNNIWTIHGLWPTKIGKIGPEYCNKSMKFDYSKLNPIKTQLSEYWPNIEKEKKSYYLWEHEWDKHGTCGTNMPSLDNEIKYFNQTLHLLQSFSVSEALTKMKIFPDSSHTFDSTIIYEAVKNAVGKNPIFHCYTDPHSGDVYLNEIRLCLNKNFEIIDCDEAIIEIDNLVLRSDDKDIKNKLNNCDISKPLIYPNKPIQKSNKEWKLHLVEIFKFISFLRWFTF